MIRKLIFDLLDEYRYRGVPLAVPLKKQPRSPTQVGFLVANQVAWLDTNIPKFKKFREQAESARGA